MIKSLIKSDLHAKDLTFKRAKLNVLKSWSSPCFEIDCGWHGMQIKFDGDLVLGRWTNFLFLPIQTLIFPATETMGPGFSSEKSGSTFACKPGPRAHQTLVASSVGLVLGCWRGFGFGWDSDGRGVSLMPAVTSLFIWSVNSSMGEEGDWISNESDESSLTAAPGRGQEV